MSGVSVLQTTARLRKFQTSAKSSGRRSKWVQSAHLAAAVPWDGVSWFSPIGHHHQARERSGSSTRHTAPGTQHQVHSPGHTAPGTQHRAWQRPIPPAALGTQHPAGSTGHRSVPAAPSMECAACGSLVPKRSPPWLLLPAQCTLMEYFGNFRNWRSLSFRLCFRAISALAFSSTSWSVSRMILALSSAFLSPECLKSFCSDSSSTLSKMLATAFLRSAVSKR